MDSLPLSLLQLNIVFQILEKMANWDLCHLRVANRAVDALVGKFERCFKNRHELGITLNFSVDDEDTSLLKIELTHGFDVVKLHSEEASSWSTAPFKVLKNIAISSINMDIYKHAEERMAKKVTEILKTVNLSCAEMNFWGTEAEDIVDITNLVHWNGVINVAVGTSNTREFVETLQGATKKSQMSLDQQNDTAFGRRPFFHQIKDFRNSFFMGTVTPHQFHQYLSDIYISEDSGNLGAICFETCVALGEDTFFQHGIPTPPFEVLWDKKTLLVEKEIPSWVPKTARKLELASKWAVVMEDEDKNTEMAKISAATVYLIEKNPTELFELLKRRGIVGDMEEETKRKFCMAKDTRRAEILRNLL